MNLWHHKKSIIHTLIIACCLVGMSMSLVSAADISATVWDVELTFCNKNNLLDHNRHLKMEVDPNKEQEICLEFSNTTDYDVPLKVNFIDGWITADQNARRACKNETSKDWFGQYVKGNNSTITIPTKWKTKVIKTIKMSDAHIGYNYGCVTYSVPNGQVTKKGGVSYNVVVRKAWFIDMIVKGKIVSRLDVLWPEGVHNVAYAESSYASWSLIAWALGVKEYEDYVDVYTILKNSGNVPLRIGGKGTMKDILGKTIQLWTGYLYLLPNESKEFHLSVSKPAWWHFNKESTGSDISSIPRYRMNYNAFVDIAYIPDIANDGLDLSDYSGNYHLWWTIFLMPWWLLIVIGCVTLIVIVALIRRHCKKRKEQKTMSTTVIQE